MLLDRNSQLINLLAEIVDLRPPCQMSDIFEILQSSPDLGSVSLDLRSDVFPRRLGSRQSAIKFEPECHQSNYTAYTLLLQGPYRPRGSPSGARSGAYLAAHFSHQYSSPL